MNKKGNIGGNLIWTQLVLQIDNTFEFFDKLSKLIELIEPIYEIWQEVKLPNRVILNCQIFSLMLVINYIDSS